MPSLSLSLPLPSLSEPGGTQLTQLTRLIYSIPYDIMLRNRISRKGRGRQDIHGYDVCLPKLQMLRFCFPSSGSACQLNIVNESLVFRLCSNSSLFMLLLISLFNWHYLNLQVFWTGREGSE